MLTDLKRTFRTAILRYSSAFDSKKNGHPSRLLHTRARISLLLTLTGSGSETNTSWAGYSVFMLMLSSDGVPAAAAAASCCLSMMPGVVGSVRLRSCVVWTGSGCCCHTPVGTPSPVEWERWVYAVVCVCSYVDGLPAERMLQRSATGLWLNGGERRRKRATGERGFPPPGRPRRAVG